jgi:hypothetical protein
MFTAGMVLSINTFFYAMDYDWVPCQVTAWVYTMTINACIILYTQRAWILLFRFEITENLCVLNQMKRSGCSAEEMAAKEGWFLRNRDRIRPPSLFLWLLIDYGLQIAFLSTATVLDPASNQRSCNARDNTVKTLYYTSLLMAPRAILLIILAWKLRSKGMDNFMFKTELKYIGLIVLTNALASPLLNAIYSPVNWDFWTGWIATIATFWPSVLKPVKCSYDEERRHNTELPMDLSNLRTILKLDVGFKSFLDFLTTEFSTENLLCWRELDEWLTQAEASKRKEETQGKQTITDVRKGE